MVLKIPQPETLTFQGIWDLRVMYFAYALSFIVLFSLWDHHRKFFEKVEYIDNKVVWVYSIFIFFTTFLPLFTSWVAHEPYAIVPELMFGFIFFTENILFILSSEVTTRRDIHNTLLDEINYNKIFIINTLLFIIGAIITVNGYPITMMLVCIFTVITWNIYTHINETYNVGET